MTKIPTRERDGVTILDLSGKITIGKGDIALRESVQSALENGSKNILINFSKVKRIDSSGLGELVASHENVKGLGGALKVTNLPSSIEDLLAITALMTVIEVFQEEDEAVATFS